MNELFGEDSLFPSDGESVNPLDDLLAELLDTEADGPQEFAGMNASTVEDQPSTESLYASLSLDMTPTEVAEPVASEPEIPVADLDSLAALVEVTNLEPVEVSAPVPAAPVVDVIEEASSGEPAEEVEEDGFDIPEPDFLFADEVVEAAAPLEQDVPHAPEVETIATVPEPDVLGVVDEAATVIPAPQQPQSPEPGPPPATDAVPTPTPTAQIPAGQDLARKISDIDRALAPIHANTVNAHAARRRRDQDGCIVFSLDGTGYALPIKAVSEIDTVPPVTRVPNVPRIIRGVTNMRGEVLPVLDLRLMLGLESTEQLDRGRILVLRSAGQDLVAVVVDEVRGTADLPLSSLQPADGVTDAVASVLHGIGTYGDRIVNVLDVDKLLASTEVRSLS